MVDTGGCKDADASAAKNQGLKYDRYKTMCAMDIKLNPRKNAASDAPQAKRWRKSVRGYINGILHEIKKISWTTKDELKLSTKVVILSIFAFGLGIYIVDLAIKNVLDLVGKLA